jgi:hypothetical protein
MYMSILVWIYIYIFIWVYLYILVCIHILVYNICIDTIVCIFIYM